jgi:hypothetical protein
MNLGDGLGANHGNLCATTECDARRQCGPRILNGRDFMVSSIHPVQPIAMRAHTSLQAGR